MAEITVNAQATYTLTLTEEEARTLVGVVYARTEALSELRYRNPTIYDVIGPLQKVLQSRGVEADGFGL